jgi:arylsulfatase A-like enzyme
VVNYDFLPTFIDWAGGDPEQLQNIDGVSLADYMAGKKPDEAFLNRNLYFHYPHYRSSVPHSAMISGQFKVLHFYAEPDIPILIDLSKDLGEVSNIARQYPETHRKLYDEMMRYLKEVGARFPKPNPDYDPEVYRQDRKTQERLQWGPFEGQRTLDDDEI